MGEGEQFKAFDQTENPSNYIPKKQERNEVKSDPDMKFYKQVMSYSPRNGFTSIRSKAVLGSRCTVCIKPQPYDYLACSFGVAGAGTGFVKNLHESNDHGWFGTVNKSTTLGQSTPKKPTDLIGYNCALGKIKGINSTVEKSRLRKDLVNEFVNGASYTYGAVVGPVAIGVGSNRVRPIVKKSSPIYGSYAEEVVIGSIGPNLEISGSSEVKLK